MCSLIIFAGRKSDCIFGRILFNELVTPFLNYQLALWNLFQFINFILVSAEKAKSQYIL